MIGMGCSESTAAGNGLISSKNFEGMLASLPKDSTPGWVVLDVRREDEIKAKRLPSANSLGANVPLIYHELSTLETVLHSLPKEKLIYCFCRSGNRSGKAAELLGSKGFTAVNVEGGILALDHLAVSG